MKVTPNREARSYPISTKGRKAGVKVQPMPSNRRIPMFTCKICYGLLAHITVGVLPQGLGVGIAEANGLDRSREAINLGVGHNAVEIA